MIVAPCCASILPFRCNLLVGCQNRGIVISYAVRVSRSSLLGFLMGTPIAIPLRANFNTVLLEYSFGRTIPKWDMGSDCISDVSIIVTLYLTLKVDISNTSAFCLDSALFIHMIIPSSFSVLTVTSEPIIGSSNCPISSDNPKTFTEQSCIARVIHTLPRSDVSAWVSSSKISSTFSDRYCQVSTTLMSSELSLVIALAVGDVAHFLFVVFDKDEGYILGLVRGSLPLFRFQLWG